MPGPGTLGRLLEIAVASAVGGLTYLGMAAALRLPELATIVAVVLNLFGRPARAGTR